MAAQGSEPPTGASSGLCRSRDGLQLLEDGVDVGLCLLNQRGRIRRDGRVQPVRGDGVHVLVERRGLHLGDHPGAGLVGLLVDRCRLQG